LRFSISSAISASLLEAFFNAETNFFSAVLDFFVQPAPEILKLRHVFRLRAALRAA
jgi:hypothetical protein